MYTTWASKPYYNWIYNLALKSFYLSVFDIKLVFDCNEKFVQVCSISLRPTDYVGSCGVWVFICAQMCLHTQTHTHLLRVSKTRPKY